MYIKFNDALVQVICKKARNNGTGNELLEKYYYEWPFDRGSFLYNAYLSIFFNIGFLYVIKTITVYL